MASIGGSGSEPIALRQAERSGPGGGAPNEPAQMRRIYQAAIEFESLLVQKMLSSMRGASESLAGTERSHAEISLYREIADAQLAQGIAANNRSGLAAQLFRQLTGAPPSAELIASSRRATPHLPGSTAAPPPRLLPTPSAGPASPPSRHQLQSIVASAAARHGLPPGLAEAVVARESDWDSTAVSPRGAIGLMQLMPGTVAELGIGDPRDPRENAEGGTRYLASMLRRFDDDVPLALAAYNAGPGAVERHGGIPPFPETVDYVQRVLRSWTYEPGLNSSANQTMLR